MTVAGSAYLDRLDFRDFTELQQWMLQYIFDDIVAEVKLGALTYDQAVAVLDRLAAKLREMEPDD